MQFKVELVLAILVLALIRCCCCFDDVLPERTIGSSATGARNHHLQRHSHHLRKFNDLPAWAFDESFVLVDYLADGELERRISYNGITAKETSMGYNTSKSLSLRQISNGYGFIQLIYSNLGEMIDCEYVRQTHLVHEFLSKFYLEIDTARSRNFTSPPFTPRHSPLISNHEFRQFVDDDIIPDEFYDLDDITPVNDAFGMRNLTYRRILSTTDVPEDMRQWLNYNELKMQCAQRHRQMKALVQGMNSKDENDRKNATEHFQRKKRDLSQWLIAPNTKWCGRGHSANRYSQLGGASRADKCCRKHDHCRLNIPGMTTKWQIFNFRPFTISHCKCDMRFRTCLKMADSSDANMVGKLFFNIIQTKCFVLKPEKMCKRRSWWGKCEKQVLRKRAHIRDNRQF